MNKLLGGSLPEMDGYPPQILVAILKEYDDEPMDHGVLILEIQAIFEVIPMCLSLKNCPWLEKVLNLDACGS